MKHIVLIPIYNDWKSLEKLINKFLEKISSDLNKNSK